MSTRALALTRNACGCADDPTHGMYVWLDALSNYLTVAGYPGTGSASTPLAAWPNTCHVIGKDIVRMVSVMEHLPGRRQSKDVEAYIHRRMADTGETRAVAERETQELLNFSDEISSKVRPAVVALAHAHKLPLLSHDDTELEHIDEALGEGISVSEFPCTLEAARKAKSHAMHVVGGAPNVIRGGSQSGNIAVSALLAEDLVDILASDYVPRSLLDCAFLIGLDDAFHADLPAALRMVSKTPAEVAGLSDRGEIAEGKRADLLHVGVLNGHPFIKQAWRNGQRVL